MESSSKIARFLFCSVFIFPFVPLVFYFQWQPKLSFTEILVYFKQSFFQASLSCLFIAAVGLVFSMGLIALGESKWRKWIVAGSVLPAFAPTIFIVMSFQLWLDFFQVASAEGLVLVAMVHGLMNFGLAGTLFFYLVESGLSSQASLAYLEGANKFRILIQLVRARIKDFVVIMISFFGLCFTSFAIPMILGGQSGGTLEILAYRALSQEGDLLGAFLLMLAQWIFFFGLIRPFSNQIRSIKYSMRRLPTELGFPMGWIGLVATTVCLGGMLLSLGVGLEQFMTLTQSSFQLFPLWLRSLGVAMMSGLLSLSFYLGLAFLWADQNLHRFLLGYGSVSSVLLGLGFFVLPVPLFMSLGLGLSILFFPLAYRIFGAPQLLALTGQCEVAELMGASRAERFTQIVLPQALPSALRLSGVVAFWSIGEYAFSSVVTGELFNLSLLAKSFMLGYRLELAALLNWILLITGGSLFLIAFWSADVCRRKLEI